MDSWPVSSLLHLPHISLSLPVNGTILSCINFFPLKEIFNTIFSPFGCKIIDMKHILGIVDNLVNWQEVGEYLLISNKYWTAAAVMCTVVSHTGASAHCKVYQASAEFFYSWKIDR